MRRLDQSKPFFMWFAGIALIITACAPSTPQTQAPVIEAPQEVQRITLEESKAAFDNHSAIFLDVRSETAYETNHIPGALSIPLAELQPRIDELDPDQWLITYCT